MLLFKRGYSVELIRRVVNADNILQRCKLHFKEMATKSIYEEAVYALNGLQSNAAALQKSRLERSAKAHLNLSDTKRHLENLGIKDEDLDNLNIIHVAGTKGKGSTCAFTEAILRKHGYKTGFYSSPHLVSVNERIRISGQPIPKEMFAEYFFKVYHNIHSNLEIDENMPPYFLFLTVLAFYVFVKERVEAAVVEVGIGGLWDCTNFIKKPVVVGISTLGIDHVNILGHTLPEIAVQKAGIFKPGVPAFTVSQHESAMQVLRQKARAIKCPLLLSPPVEVFEQTLSLGMQGAIQSVNASLALQLTHEWLRKKGENGVFIDAPLDIPIPLARTFDVDAKTVEALEKCVWPGRFQVIERGKITYFLDGAHTLQSMRHCTRWFESCSGVNRVMHDQPVLRILLFNCTGDRKVENLLLPLSDVQFDLVIFCPNRPHSMKDAASDLSNFMIDPEKEMQLVASNRKIWRHLVESVDENELNVFGMNSSLPVSTATSSNYKDNTLEFPTISDALQLICSPAALEKVCVHNSDSNSDVIERACRVHVLVTGSLHLVGGVLSLLES